MSMCSLYNVITIKGPCQPNEGVNFTRSESAVSRQTFLAHVLTPKPIVALIAYLGASAKALTPT